MYSHIHNLLNFKVNQMDKLLFFDIETHRVVDYKDAPQLLKNAWEDHLWDHDEFKSVEDSYNEKAGLYAEFSKVICISMGYEQSNGEFKVSSLIGKNEKDILEKFSYMCAQFKDAGYSLIGHNILKFDIPYLCKRYIINGMKIPVWINSMGLKPWEVSHRDTMDMWKFGDWKNTSLQVIASCLGIPSKTTEITGQNMYTKSIDELDFEMLKVYCEEDVKVDYKIYKVILNSL